MSQDSTDRVVQIAVAASAMAGSAVVALTESGAIWVTVSPRWDGWTQLPPIPSQKDA